VSFSFRKCSGTVSEHHSECDAERFLSMNYTCLTVQAKSKLKRWGNSFGVVVPKDIVEKEGLKEGEVVEISVRKASDIKQLFGKYPFRNLQRQKERMRRGWE